MFFKRKKKQNYVADESLSSLGFRLFVMDLVNSEYKGYRYEAFATWEGLVILDKQADKISAVYFKNGSYKIYDYDDDVLDMLAGIIYYYQQV